MTPFQIKQRLSVCETETDLEYAFSEMRVPDIRHIIDTFEAMKQLSELKIRDEYILSRARIAYDKMAGNLRDPAPFKQQQSTH